MRPTRWWDISLAVVLAATPFSGCDYPTVPEATVEPSVIGVIQDAVRIDDSGGHRYSLEDGTEVLWPADGEHLEGPIGPGRGDLLIYGEAPVANGATPWRAVGSGPGGPVDDRGSMIGSPCYRLSVDGEIRDDVMALTLGFSLPLADSFDYALGDERYLNLPGGWFCLDADGRVTSATAAPQRP